MALFSKIIALGFLALFQFHFSKAQNGASCDSSIFIVPSSSFIVNDYSLAGSDTVMWFGFVANSTTTNVEIALPATTIHSPVSHLHSLKLFSGSCSSLILLSERNIDSVDGMGRKEILLIPASDLNIGTTYYISVEKKTLSSCLDGLCGSSSSWFGISLLNTVAGPSCSGGNCDCENPIVVCPTNNKVTFPLSLGSGNFSSLPPICSFGNPVNDVSCQAPNNYHPGGSTNGGCLKTGEVNSTWLLITITGTGWLNFNFDGSTQNQAGLYDWIMYPYNPTTACSDIAGNLLAPVRCNWNASNTGGSGIGAPPFGGNPFNYEPALNVICGQQYIICFSNFSGVSGHTVTMTFGGSATVGCPATLPITATGSPMCPGTSSQLSANASGATSYTWSPSGSLSCNNCQSPVATPSATTTYTVTASTPSSSSCTSVSTIVTVQVYPQPVVNLTWTQNSSSTGVPGPAVICAGTGVYLLSGSLGYIYNWTPGNFSTSFIHVFPSSTTTYTLNVTDANGCTNSGTITVIVVPAPVLTTSFTSPWCYGGQNGNATVTVSPSNNPPYTYLWSPGGQTTTTVPHLAAGTYTVTVTDANGCSTTTSVIVTQPPQLVATITATPPALCGSGTSQLNVSPSGGTPGYTYQWQPAGLLSNPNSQSTTATLTVTTTFTVVVTDSKGCTVTQTIVVPVNPIPPAGIDGGLSPCQGSSILCCPTTANAVYSWTVPSGATYIAGPGANCITVTWGAATYTGGTVSVTVSIPATGCSNTASLYIPGCCTWTQPPTCVSPNFYNINASQINTMCPGFGVGAPYTISNKSFSINGTLTIDQDLVLTQNCLVKLGQNAQIIINPGVRLTIDNSHLFACSEMWYGITVDGTNPNSLLTITDRSTIEDAQYAVISNNGGKVVIAGSSSGDVIFNKNLVAVQINSCGGAFPGSIRRTTITCADNATLYTYASSPLNTLRSPNTAKRSQYGIQITDVNNIQIGDATSLPLKNTFNNLDVGIEILRSNVVVYNCEFNNITAPSPSPPCFPTCPVVGHAIHATGLVNYGPRSLVVGGTGFKQNKFLNCTYGVNVSTYYNVSVVNNIFSNTNFSSTNVYGGMPVYIEYCSGRTILVQKNNIRDAVFGIRCYVNVGANTSIAQNDIDLTSTNLNQNARGIWIQELTPNISTVVGITDNDVNHMRYGIRIENLYKPRVITNRLFVIHLPFQSNLQYASGIFAMGCVAPFIADNTAQSSVPLSEQNYWISGIRVDLSDGAQVQCNTTLNIGDGLFSSGQMPNTQFRNNSMLDDHYRGFVQNFGYVGAQGAAGSPNDNQWDIVGTNFTFHTYCFNASLPINLYVRNPQTTPFWPSGMVNIGNPVPTNAFIPQGTSGTSGITCSALGVDGNQQLAHSIINDQLSFSTDSLENNVLSKLSLYRTFPLDSSMQNDAALVLFSDSMDVAAAGQLDSVAKQVSVPMTVATVQSLLLQNTDVLPTDTIAATQQSVNRIALENMVIGSSDYSADEIAELRKIASLCPFQYGPSVYEARVILSSIDPLLTEYFSECELPPAPTSAERKSRPSEEKSEHVEFSIYPNPASEELNIITTLSQNEAGTIVIENVLGQVLMTQSIVAGENNLKISVSELAPGIYIYRELVNGVQTATGKIIIQR